MYCWSLGFCQPGFFFAWSLQSRFCISGEWCDNFWQGWMVSRDLGLISVQMSHCFRYLTLVQHIGWVTFLRVTQWVKDTNWETDSLRCLVLKSCRLCSLPKSCTGCSGFLSLCLVFDYLAKLDFFQDLVSVIDFITLCFINPTLPAPCSLVLFSQAGQICGSRIHQQNCCNLWTSSAVKICVCIWGVCGVFLT